MLNPLMLDPSSRLYPEEFAGEIQRGAGSDQLFGRSDRPGTSPVQQVSFLELLSREVTMLSSPGA